MKLDYSVLILIGLSNLLLVMNINISSALAVAEGWNKSENGQILWRNKCGFHGESGELLRGLTAEQCGLQCINRPMTCNITCRTIAESVV